MTLAKIAKQITEKGKVTRGLVGELKQLDACLVFVNTSGLVTVGGAFTRRVDGLGKPVLLGRDEAKVIVEPEGRSYVEFDKARGVYGFVTNVEPRHEFRLVEPAGRGFVYALAHVVEKTIDHCDLRKDMIVIRLADETGITRQEYRVSKTTEEHITWRRALKVKEGERRKYGENQTVKRYSLRGHRFVEVEV